MADRFSPVAITGMGVVCSIAHAIPDFTKAIREGRHGFTKLPVDENHSVRIGALVQDFVWQGLGGVVEDRASPVCIRALERC